MLVRWPLHVSHLRVLASAGQPCLCVGLCRSVMFVCWPLQVSQYESLVEEATRAREEAAKDAAELRQQMSDIANDLQVCDLHVALRALGRL